MTRKVPKNISAQPRDLEELKTEFPENDHLSFPKRFSGDRSLSEAWQEFQDSLITRQRFGNQDVIYKTDEASLFFSEERVLDQNLNLRFWNSVPALLVGIGILGTFVGLVWGLIPFSGIDFSQTANIQEAIKGLLSGVSTAFVTSVWGMLASLVFNFLEKFGIGSIRKSIAELQRALDQLFTLTTQEEIAFRQEDELAQQTQALKAFSTDLANEIKSAMAQGRQEIITEFRNAPETFSNAIGEQLTPSLNNLNSAVNGIQRTIVAGNQEILRELHNAPDAFSNMIVEKFAPSFNSLNIAVQELRRQKEESSTLAIQKLVEEFQKSLSGSASAQMETLAETVRQASASLVTLPKQLEGMMAGVQEQVDHTRQLLSQTSESQTEQVKIMMEGVASAFQNAIDTHEAGLTATTDSMNEEMKQIANDIRELLESAADRTDAQLAQRMADIEQTSAQTLQTLQISIAELQKSMTSTASQTTEKSEAMITQMYQLVEQSTTRLEGIFKSGESGVSELLQQQEVQIKEVNAQITNSRQTLEKSSEMLQQMDASVTRVRGLLKNTETLSNLLITNSDKLEDASDRLMEASDVFSEETSEYLTANREMTQQLLNALGQSQQLLNDFSQHFQVIDAGLTNIFEEIEGGLTNYSTITRDSINTYLMDFSKHLTDASKALDGSVAALAESVQELEDMHGQLINRWGHR